MFNSGSVTFTRAEAMEESLKYFDGDEMAANSAVNKYLLRDYQNNYYEKSPDDYLKGRLSHELARIESYYPNSMTAENVYEYLKGFNHIVLQGSPTRGIGNHLQVISLSNCYTQGQVSDSYAGIFMKDQELAQVFKRTGGTSVELSKLRPSGMKVNNCALKSDGIKLFMKRFSNTTKEVSQNSRAGALLMGLDVNHPEIETFINVKRNLSDITGANISVKFTDEFMKAVESNSKFTLQYPTDVPLSKAVVKKEIDAKTIWDMFIESNYLSAEPGAFFWDRVTKQSISDCYAKFGFKTILSNPCQPAWAKVLTKDGIKTIGDLKIGDEIWSKDGWTKVINKWSTGTKPVYKYKTSVGVFYGTENHRVVSNGEKIEACLATTIDLLTGPKIGNHNFNDGEILYLSPDRKELEEKQAEYNAKGIAACIDDNALVYYDDIIEEDMTIWKSSKPVSTEEVFDITVDNPSHTYWTQGCNVSNCGEIPMSEYNSCLLTLLNLTGYVDDRFTDKASFNVEKFIKHVRVAVRLMDDIVDLELEKIDAIIEKVKSDPESELEKMYELNLWNNVRKYMDMGRRVGLGVTGLADMLAYLNIKYDSDEAVQFVDEMFSTFHTIAYDEGAELAKERGPFKCWNWELEKESHYIKRLPISTKNKIEKYGRRNIAQLTIAPAGTISILTKTSSGCEPVFMTEYSRSRKITAADPENIPVTRVDSDGIKWTTTTIYHHGVKEWMKVTGKTDIKESPYYGCTAEEIDPYYRVKLQGIINQHIDHSISSTVNLKSDITREEISKIYIEAWKAGCKGLTVYRSGSRDGVLESTNNKNDKKTVNNELVDGIHSKDIVESYCPKRPEVLPCHIYHSNVVFGKENVQKWVFFIGLLNGAPFEIWGGLKSSVIIPKKITNGWIKKNKKSHGEEQSKYDLILGSLEDVDEQTVIKDIAAMFRPNESTITRLVSTLLRHGVPPVVVAQQLSKDGDNSEMFAQEKVISRLITKNFVKDGTKASGTKCKKCGGDMIYSGGCQACSQCGDSKCG